MQVCNSMASVKIDDMQIIDNGINIEGVVETNIIYISDKDSSPINSIKQIVPFTHVVEVNGIKADSVYSIKPYMEQVNMVTLTGNELEQKVTINIDTMVFNRNSIKVITNLEEKEYDKDKIDKIASMVGYIVKDGEDMWDIAKRFYTSVDMLKKINTHVDNIVKAGDKLLIVKRKY